MSGDALTFTDWHVPRRRNAPPSPSKVHQKYTKRYTENIIEEALETKQPNFEWNPTCTGMVINSPHATGSWISIPCQVSFDNTVVICESPPIYRKLYYILTDHTAYTLCPKYWSTVHAGCSLLHLHPYKSHYNQTQFCKMYGGKLFGLAQRHDYFLKSIKIGRAHV